MVKKKMKLVIALLLVVAVFSVASAQEKPKLARLHYQGGGDWYNDGDALPNLAEFTNQVLNTNFALQEAIVKPDNNKLFNFPFLFMTGHGQVKFSEEDIKNLREYLSRGGFLYVDDDYGLDESFRREIKKIFPQKNLIELPSSHELINGFYPFPKGMPKIHEHDNKRPQAFAIFNDVGRLLVLYTYETNLSDGWTVNHNDPPEIREKALKMGANIIHYVMTK
ncbi:MAG: hypothetical protein PWQ09_1801 [Candidatus Cloacimonadota bacterium]|jgi:hypothetical protein|nr:hypothetical protein [Candidatus Cloacimonadota bacterium]